LDIAVPPKKNSFFYKFWWDSELDKLKEFSINVHTVWKEARPPDPLAVFKVPAFGRGMGKRMEMEEREGERELSDLC